MQGPVNPGHAWESPEEGSVFVLCSFCSHVLLECQVYITHCIIYHVSLCGISAIATVYWARHESLQSEDQYISENTEFRTTSPKL